MDKQNKAFKVLEFDKILERLSSYTESKDVKKRIEEIGSVYGIRGRNGRHRKKRQRQCQPY